MKIKKRIWIKLLSWTLFILYIIGIFYFMFFSERYGRTDEVEGYRYNLVLFREIKRCINYQKVIGLESFIVNFFGNVLAFIPFGFCIPMISKKDNKFLHVLLLTFGFSLTIETIQLLYKIGCFDVDDLLLNTIGGVLGFFVYRIVYYFLKRKSKVGV